MYRVTFIIMFFTNLTFGQTLDMKKELINRLNNASEYTIAVLEKMPEEKLSFRPTKGVRSFGEIMQHIGEAQLYTASQGLKIKQTKFNSDLTSKKELKTFIKNSYKSLIDAVQLLTTEDLNKQVNFWDGKASVHKILNFTIDHVTHHRGQATIYLRLNNIKPPDYIGW